MPHLASRPFKHALSFALSVTHQNDAAPFQLVHLRALDGVLTVAARGSRGAAAVEIGLTSYVEPAAFTIHAVEASQLFEVLPSVGVQHIDFGRDTLTVTGDLSEKRIKRASTRTPDVDGWFRQDRLSLTDDKRPFPVHLIWSALTCFARMTGPNVRVALGGGASPLIVEAANPHLGGMLSARFAVPSEGA